MVLQSIAIIIFKQYSVKQFWEYYNGNRLQDLLGYSVLPGGNIA